jgi:cation diffusion facilitator family transporter
LKEGNIAIGTSFVAMIISTVVLIYKARAARKLEMLSMKTEVVNSFTDSLSSISAFIGITLSEKLGIIQFDSIVGIIIGIFVLTSSYMIIKESSLVLMDACTCSDVHGDLETLVRSIPGVEKVKSVRLRRMGSYIVGDISVVVDGSLSVDEANRISQRVEKEAKKVFDDISEIVVKFEPSEKKASQINHSCTIHE